MAPKQVDWNQIDWDLIRMEYELFHISFEEIHEKTGIPVAHLHDVAAEGNWSPHPLAQRVRAIQDAKDLVEVTGEFKKSLEDKLEMAKLLKQELLAPDYMRLEAVLLKKAITIIQNLKEQDDPQASKKLKDVASVLSVLLSQNGLLGMAGNDGDGPRRLDVKIMTCAEGENGGSKSAVQISTS